MLARETPRATRRMPPTRNGPCPCGSGYKFKRCCANRKAKNPESTLLLEAESSSRPRKKAVSLILSLVLLLAAGAAYHHTLQVPFLFDDAFSIVNNRRIHQLWPLWQLLGATNRPFVDLTFALNYAISGLNVTSYHAVNIAIHLIAGLFLFGLLRRTCKRFWISFSVALLWLLHPLHTQSITYLSQRAESLMGLCFLAMLYAIARGTTANPFKAVWILAAIGFCALGMLTKPVMVIAPIVALLYDRTFFAGSFSAAWKKRPWLYIGLATTWLLLLPGILRPFPAMEDITVGWHIPGLKPLSYLFSQPAVIWHYLRLAFWPTSLCFDYQWPLSESMEAILIPSLGLGLLALMTIVAWRIFKPIGFLGIWFFLTLAPSSSFIPVADLAAEHRMYLALIGPVTVVVAAAIWALDRFSASRVRKQAFAAALLIAAAVPLGMRTWHRNADYHTERSLWTDTLKKRPHNPRAHFNLGLAAAKEGNLQEASEHYANALRLAPEYVEAHNNLGNIQAGQGKPELAKSHLEQALRIKPNDAEVRNNLANILSRQGRLEEALQQYEEALRLQPETAEAHINLGALLEKMGRLEEAIPHYQEAIRLKPALAAVNPSKLDRYVEIRNHNR